MGIRDDPEGAPFILAAVTIAFGFFFVVPYCSEPSASSPEIRLRGFGNAQRFEHYSCGPAGPAVVSLGRKMHSDDLEGAAATPPQNYTAAPPRVYDLYKHWTAMFDQVQSHFSCHSPLRDGYLVAPKRQASSRFS